MPGRIRQGFRSPSGTPAAIWLSRSHSFGCERVFSRHARVPSGAPCIFGSIQQAGAAAYAPEASFWASEILRQTIWVGGRGPARRYHTFRVPAGPQNDADCAASPIRGVADGDRDAEYSGFCTVQAGVRWDGKGCPRLFMHDASEIMQDNRAPCTGYPDWGRHAPRYGVGCLTGNSHEGYKTIETSKYRLKTVYRRINTVHRS